MSVEESEPLSSDDENQKKRITLEHVIEQCGPFGRFQFLHTFFLVFFPIASGIVNFYFVFGAAEPDYVCRSARGHQIDPTQCFYEGMDETNQTDSYWCTEWAYDRTVFGKTFTEEANLVCQHRIYRSFLASALQCGAMFIFFTGQITDFIGRRRSMHLLVGLFVGVSIITQSLIQFATITITQKFILLLINQFFSGIDTYMISFLLMMELSGSAYTNLVGNLALLSFAVGQIVVTIMAYLCRDWLLLKWVITIYMLVIMPYLYFVPESPRWLLTKGRYDELEKVLDRMARINRRDPDQWYGFYRYVIHQHQLEKSMNNKTRIRLSLGAKLRRFLTHRPTMTKLIISGFIGFITLFLYFKVAYGLGAMEEIDPYLSVMIGAFVEILGYICASLLMIRFGRKTVFILFILLMAMCLAGTPYFHQHSRFLSIIISQLAKFAISGAVCVTYIFVPELFPTSIRGTGMGFFVLLSRIGSVLGPTIDSWFPRHHSSETLIWYLYSFISLLTIAFTLFLPETRNVPLEDKIDYQMGKKNRNEGRC